MGGAKKRGGGAGSTETTLNNYLKRCECQQGENTGQLACARFSAQLAEQDRSWHSSDFVVVKGSGGGLRGVGCKGQQL